MSVATVGSSEHYFAVGLRSQHVHVRCYLLIAHLILNICNVSCMQIVRRGRGSVVKATEPRAGSGVVRMDPLRFLAGCRTRRLNQA